MSRKNVPKDIEDQVFPPEKRSARRGWRYFLGILVVSQLIVTDVLIVCLATGCWHISTADLGIFLTKVFAEIAGFVYIAIRFDFSE